MAKKLKLVCYNTSAYQNTSEYIVSEILGTLAPDEITEDDRKELKSGAAESMCNFMKEDGTWMAVPWSFVISIEPVFTEDEGDLARICKAVKAFGYRCYGREIDDTRDPRNIGLAFTEFIPGETFTKEELRKHNFPEDKWNDRYPQDIVFNAIDGELSCWLNGIEISKENFASVDDVLKFLRERSLDDLLALPIDVYDVFPILTFDVQTSVENIRDSMQLDTLTPIARLQIGNYVAEIEVAGDVRVTYDKQVYRKPSRFPKFVKDAFAQGVGYECEEIQVGDNNWFSLQYGVIIEGEDTTEYDPDDVLVDVEGMSKTQLYLFMDKKLRKYIRDHRD